MKTQCIASCRRSGTVLFGTWHGFRIELKIKANTTRFLLNLGPYVAHYYIVMSYLGRQTQVSCLELVSWVLPQSEFFSFLLRTFLRRAYTITGDHS